MTSFLIFSRVKPLRSKREIISPTKPRATPSGLTMMNVCSIAMWRRVTVFYSRSSLYGQPPSPPPLPAFGGPPPTVASLLGGEMRRSVTAAQRAHQHFPDFADQVQRASHQD